jgi:hypothetical protein
MALTARTSRRRTRAARRYCVACGALLQGRRRKWCSPDCRQHLLDTLDRRTGLLRALNTRYATFQFSSTLIVLNLLPYGMEQVYGFYLKRAVHHRPADDFRTLANQLGNAWWKEKRRTHKHYMASRHLLEVMADQRNGSACINPVNLSRPSVNGRSLMLLKLGKADLKRPDLEKVIKRAFRNQAMHHHPDRGGEGTMFRKVHDAYQALIQWARHPSFIVRRGFPDKWFYTAETNRWVQPLSK